MQAEEDSPPLPLIPRIWGSSAVRYVAAGGASFLFDIGVLWLLHDVFKVPLVVSTPVAFLLSFAVTYGLQRTLAFRSTDGVGPSVLRYAVLVAFNTVATTLIVSGTAALGIPWEIGKVAAVVATTIWNYFVYRYWVFADRNPKN